tara:strand:+ start:1860 stop:3044 length:1185 start_codon:yes stop_codon:yes gene_type:complete
MNEEEKQNVIAAIQTLPEETIESWFDISEPSFFARMAASVGFIRLPRQLDLNNLPSQFFDDVNYFTGGVNVDPDEPPDRLLGGVRRALQNYYVTDLTTYPDENGVRTPRLVRTSLNGPNMGDIGDDVARFLLAEIPTPDLAPGMMFLQEPQIKRNLIRENPNDPNSNFRESPAYFDLANLEVRGIMFDEDVPLQPGEKVSYIDSRTRETIMQNGEYRFEEAGKGKLNFFYRIDGLEFKYPSSKINFDDDKFNVQPDFGSRGITLPGAVANTREFATSFLDDDNFEQTVDDKVAYINRHPIRPLIDNEENRAALKENVRAGAKRMVKREEEIRKIQRGDLDLTVWDIIRGQFGMAAGLGMGRSVDDALKFEAMMNPGDALTTRNDVDAFELRLRK